MRVRKRFAARFGQKGSLMVLATATLAALYLFQIGSLVPGASAGEIAAKQQSSSLEIIVNNPLYAPHKFAQYSLQKIGVDGIAAFRAITAVVAILFVLCFHNLVRRWHSRRIAVLVTTLLASSSWLLSVGRSATPTIMLTAWFFVIWLLLWFRYSRSVRLAPVILLLSLSALIYIPGTIYLLGLIALWYSRKTPELFRFMKRLPIILGALFSLILLMPLAFAFVRHPSLISDWLLLPEHLSFADFLNNLRNLSTSFFYQSETNPEFWLGRLPLLDVLTGTMLILGIYAYRFHLRMERTPLITLVVLLGVIVVGAAGTQVVILILPFAYILAANGLAFLLEQWFTVFPRNPVPRTLATTLLSMAVLFASSYHIGRYFVAWANAPETKSAYSVKIEP